MSRDLYLEGKYSDVTLVSDDQTQFKAHKIVLSASSPVIKKFLMNFPSNNVIETRIYHAMILTNVGIHMKGKLSRPKYLT